MNHRIYSAIMRCLPLVLLAVVTQTFAQSTQSDEVLMTVGDESIHKDELVYLFSKTTGGAAPGVSREEFEDNLELFINYKQNQGSGKPGSG